MHPLEYLREKGWNKGSLVNAGNNSVCISGAMHNARYNASMRIEDMEECQREVPLEERIAVANAIREQFPALVATFAYIDTCSPALAPRHNIVDCQCGTCAWRLMIRFNDYSSTKRQDVELILEKVYGAPV